MDNNLTYRKCTKEDKEQLITLITGVLTELESTKCKEFFRPRSKKDFDIMCDDEYSIVFGAFDGEKLAGMAQLFVGQERFADYKKYLGIKNENICEFGGCMVAPDYRGIGVQKVLIKMRFNAARELGFNRSVATVHPDNKPSETNLLNAGFVPVKDIKIKIDEDTYWPRILMLKELNKTKEIDNNL